MKRSLSKPTDPVVMQTIEKVRSEFPWVSELALESHMTLLRANAVYHEVLAKHYSDMGLSTPRFNLLWLLFRSEGHRLSVGDLSAHIGVTIPSIMKMIPILETAGWLRTVKGVADRRVTFVELTEESVRRLTSLLPEAFRFWEELWSDLTVGEKETLNVVLAKLRITLLDKYIGETGLAAFRTRRNRDRELSGH